MEILAKAVGRRKEAVAQVQIKLGTGQFIINNKPAQEYLQTDSLGIPLLSVKAPFDVLAPAKQTETAEAEHNLKLDTIVKVKGGGLMGQAEAIRLGISRALCLLSTDGTTTGDSLPISNALDIRKQLKDKGYLTQDSRVKERRKYGLKKARKASQYHKR
jgi:small subunit ribosomal protein S9